MNHLLGIQQTFPYKLINCETIEERQEITNHMMTLANQRIVLKKDPRKKRILNDTQETQKPNTNPTTEDHK